MAPTLLVDSPNVKYTNDYIESVYDYQTTTVEKLNNKVVVHPQTARLHLKTKRVVPRVGLMLVGWGGNNGSTITAAILANKLGMTWSTKEGVKKANWFGSLTQASTVRLGPGSDGKDVCLPMSDMLPMLRPEDIVLDGWDISGLNLAESMERAQVLDYNLQVQLAPLMKDMKPKPSIYFPDFIAANQSDRADNVLTGTKWEQLEAIRKDIRDMKEQKNVDQVIVLWTANTERFAEIVEGVNDTADNLIAAIKRNEAEISPSTIFAVASILEGSTYINGSPQNTFVPGCMELAERYRVFIAGDDFKSGQTKLKSVLVDFLVNAGIKPVSIVSYNHLGNNDGRNLSAPSQFRSKEISKSNVVDDMVDSNSILYKPGEKPDHCVVIKYVPYVGDSKRALDEYTSELMLGGHNTISIHNTCEDSLLAAPIILDLVILAELCSRIQFKAENQQTYHQFHPVLSVLRTPVVNALFKQRACIENIMRACLSLPPDNHMTLEHKLPKSLFTTNVSTDKIVDKISKTFITKPEKPQQKVVA
ncbi:hypothetical protein LSTR_LSTR006356 [Laodelphax striatellus]|uniref:Inositol-3-phosphate synthase n=1 Tax=Laodelphax striatellus TaxID=195883 RepID=A0A482XCV9_LAOST|nr:hypothetical protein LSTR_LSTR006356 [Laodelphax striatellus]